MPAAITLISISTPPQFKGVSTCTGAASSPTDVGITWEEHTAAAALDASIGGNAHVIIDNNGGDRDRERDRERDGERERDRERERERDTERRDAGGMVVGVARQPSSSRSGVVELRWEEGEGCGARVEGVKNRCCVIQ